MRVIRAMTPFLVGAALIAASTLAFAQAPPPQPMPRAANPGGYGPPPPPMAYQPGSQVIERRGLTLGMSFGVGGMDCPVCSGDPMAGMFSFNIGAMINPRTAILLEVGGSMKALDETGFTMLMQTQALIAAQYWVAPKVWIKGGLGFSHLSISYDDGFVAADDPIADGGAAMASVGYEILSGPRFAIDLQGRLNVGSYKNGNDTESIQSAIIGAGFSWF